MGGLALHGEGDIVRSDGLNLQASYKKQISNPILSKYSGKPTWVGVIEVLVQDLNITKKTSALGTQNTLPGKNSRTSLAALAMSENAGGVAMVTDECCAHEELDVKGASVVYSRTEDKKRGVKKRSVSVLRWGFVRSPGQGLWLGQEQRHG